MRDLRDSSEKSEMIRKVNKKGFIEFEEMMLNWYSKFVFKFHDQGQIFSIKYKWHSAGFTSTRAHLVYRWHLHILL